LERKAAGVACLAMADIDYFKKINDTYGHIQGDRILKQLGDILSSTLRGVFDIAGRYGGEEFLLIFDETDPAEAAQVTERLRKQIEQTGFEKVDKAGDVLEHQSLNITMSFGIATLDRKSGITTASDWISRADDALYQSKQNGRNRVTLFKERKSH
jgi:diguanylate cyclase (GGDEF)-like protein